QPPAIYCMDTRRAKVINGLAEPCIAALKQRLERREQSLVFINRRGYAPVLVCTQCSWVFSCDRCASKLVIHLKKNRMRCHHCGFETRIPLACVDCGNADLLAVGH